MSFDAFLKKKKDKKEEPKASTPPAPAPKPVVPVSKPEPAKEAIAAKRQELGPEVVGDEAAKQILQSEASKAEHREDEIAKVATVPKPPKPAVPAAVPVPQPQPTPSTPASGSAPSPKSEVYTPEDLQLQVLVSDFGSKPTGNEYGGKQTITIVADKGCGKTTLSMAFRGKKLVFSYDRMAITNKFKMRADDIPNIKVIDPMTLVESGSIIRKRDSHVKVFDFLVGVEEYPNGPRHGGILDTHETVDWVIHDGTDVLMYICEMVMRWRNDLLPSQGFANLNLWKERKDAIQEVFNKSLTLARKGVIFTTYFEEKQVDEDIHGEKKVYKQPKWMDIVLQQTLHTFSMENKGENFFLFVHQSKSIRKDISKVTYDVTGTKYESDEIDPETGKKIIKLDLTKLYEVVGEIEREVF